MEQKREANLLNEASVLDALDDDDDDKELSGDEDDKAVPRWKGKTLTQNKCAQVFNHFFFIANEKFCYEEIYKHFMQSSWNRRLISYTGRYATVICIAIIINCCNASEIFRKL